MKIAVGSISTYSESGVRDLLAEMFTLMGLPKRNPLSRIITSGDRVFIKPNWVAHEYRRSCNRDGKGNVYSVITHPTVIRAVADFAAEALRGKGEIIIGDNPSIDADFPRLMELAGLGDLETRYEVPCRILDLRPLICADLKDYGKKSKMKNQRGDPEGYSIINLGGRSLFKNVNALLFRGVFDERCETIRHHSGSRHDYGLSNSILNSDVYISIPKLKTHHKVGVTINLKGLVGTNSIKNYLVHWRVGFPLIGGDAYPDFPSWVTGMTTTVKSRGAWSGNDTIWRMVVDLHTILRERIPKTFSVVDGIVGGEKNGPFCPKAKEACILIAGEDLLAVDCVATRLMDFNVRAVPYLDYLIDHEGLDLSALEVVSRDFPGGDFFSADRRYLYFAPPDRWENLAIGDPPSAGNDIC
jgi:uncharacterized protein (DUF362 family)